MITSCHERVRHAYQVLALDDERKTFHPVLWQTADGTTDAETAAGDQPESTDDKESDEKKQTVEQVWFAGAHSNVGGGYPKDFLSFVSLDWMMGKAQWCGLRLTIGSRAEVRQNADAHGRLYDSRAGWGAFYRPTLRDPYDVEGSPKVHVSVCERIKRGTQYYAPKVIKPDKFDVVWTDQGPYAKPDSGGTDGD